MENTSVIKISKEHIIIRRIRSRLLYQNKNWLCVVCGQTGSGKSYTALRIASLVDPSFTSDRIVFTPEQFLNVLTSGELKKGSAIVFDEAGVGIPAREWYSIQNKMLNYILQTFRYENLAVIFTVPSIDFIDTQARKLFHTYIQTTAIDRDRNQTILKYYDLQYNPRFGKMYFKHPRAIFENKVSSLLNARFGKPSKEILQEYEIRRQIYAAKLKDDTKAGLQKMRDKLAPKESKKEIILREANKGKKAIDIAKEFDMSYNYVRQMMAYHNVAITNGDHNI